MKKIFLGYLLIVFTVVCSSLSMVAYSKTMASHNDIINGVIKNTTDKNLTVSIYDALSGTLAKQFVVMSGQTKKYSYVHNKDAYKELAIAVDTYLQKPDFYVSDCLYFPLTGLGSMFGSLNIRKAGNSYKAYLYSVPGVEVKVNTTDHHIPGPSCPAKPLIKK